MPNDDADPRIFALDGIARELALVAGYQAAVKLMIHFGGQRIYIPDKMRPSSPFWKILGAEIAMQLPACAARMAGPSGRDSEVYIPTGSGLERARRKAEIAAYEGSKNKAAALFRVSRRTVQRYRKKSSSPDLFGPPTK